MCCIQQFSKKSDCSENNVAIYSANIKVIFEKPKTKLAGFGLKIVRRWINFTLFQTKAFH